MKISRNDAVEKSLGESWMVVEYPFEHDSLGIATSTIRWRYPKYWFSINTQSDQIYLVIRWKGKIIRSNEWEEIHQNISDWDAILMNKNKPFAVNSDNLEIVIVNSPAWNEEQYKLID